MAKRKKLSHLTRFMREVGLTDRAVAAELGIDFSTVFRIRSRRVAPSGPTLIKLVQWSRKVAAKHGIDSLSAEDILGM